jgi:uncharacterized protein with NRDE domain
MCILLCTVSHPKFPFILGSNRDEFFQRPTAKAEFKNESILMPLDLAREEHGTWIGITKTGRMCVLVNYRENVFPCQMGAISRGAISKDFLESLLDPLQWVEDIRFRTNNFENVGGFSLFFGIINKSTKLADSLYIISNRDDKIIKPFANDQTRDIFGLSNSSFFDPWPKVKHGEELMEELIKDKNTTDINELIDDMFKIMSDTSDKIKPGYSMSETINEMVKYSIFVPQLTNDLPTEKEKLQGPKYGTRTQTVLVVTQLGEVVYVERDVLTNTTQEYRFVLEMV